MREANRNIRTSIRPETTAGKARGFGPYSTRITRGVRRLNYGVLLLVCSLLVMPARSKAAAKRNHKTLIATGSTSPVRSTRSISGSSGIWTATGGPAGGNVYALAADNLNGFVYAGTDSGIYKTTDNGASWTKVAYGTSVQSIVVGLNGYVYGGTPSGLYISTDNGVNWSATGLTYNVLSLSVAPSGLILAGTYAYGIYASTDNGTTWPQVATSTTAEVYAVAANANNQMFAGTYDASYTGKGGVYRSTDGGASWTQVGIPNDWVYALAVDSSGDIVAATEGDGIYVSTDNGSTWNAQNSGLPTNMMISLTVDPSGNLFAGSDGNGIFESTDRGASWTATGPVNGTFWSVAAASSGYVFAGADSGGVYRAKSGGSTVATPAAPVPASPGNGATGLASDVSLTWSASQGAGTYSLQVSTDSTFGTTFTDLSGLGSTSDDVSGLASSTEYYWRVSATNTSGTSPWSSTWHFTTAGGSQGVPSPPALISPANFTTGASTMLRFTWASSPGASAYEFQIATDAGFTNIVNDVAPLYVPTDTMSVGLNANTTYYWRVNASDSAGTSGWSSVWTLTTGNSVSAISPPVISSPAAGASNVWVDPILSWNPSSGASSYELQVSTDPGFSSYYFDVPGITGTSLKVTGLSYGTTYYWRVMASSINSSSGWSSSAGFTTLTYPSTIQLSFNSNSYMPTDDLATSSYRMVGLPGDIDIPISNVVTGQQGSDWDAYTDNGSNQSYFVEYDGGPTFAFQPGNAFWILSRNSFSVSQSVSPVSLDTNACYAIQVHAGWNLISDPFPNTVDWTAVQNINGISQPIFTFNGGFSQTTSMDPYAGYYYYNNTGLTSLEIPYVSTTTPAAKRVESSVANNLTATLRTGSGRLSSITMGVNGENGSSGSDIFAPPQRFSTSGIYIVDSAVSAGWKEFIKEVRDTIGAGQEFDFDVRNKTGSPLSLNFSIGNGFSGYRVYLVDRDLNKSYNLADTGRIAVPAFNTVKKYSVLIGTPSYVNGKLSELVPHTFSLYQNYPNPFNPVTVIRFEIPVRERVVLTVYDVLGRRVRTLMNASESPGIYEIPFDGSELASGVYFYRIRAGSFSKVRKMLLLK